MIVYIITIVLLFIFAISEENFRLSSGVKRSMAFISFVFLVLQVGLRWETGTDWEPYYYHFISFSGVPSIILSDFEYGYGLFEYIVKQLSDDYSVFLVLHAVIYYFLVFKGLNRYTSNFYLTLMLFYTLTIGILGSNRQLLALAICLYSVRFVMEKKPILFFLSVFIATFFHTTALFFAVYYFLNRDVKPVVFISILVGAIVIGKTPIPSIIVTFFSELIGGNILYKASVYSETSLVKLSIIGLFKRLTFLAIFYYTRNQLKEKVSYYNIMFNGYFIGIIFYFLFADSLLILVNRGSLYFNLMEPLLIASQMLLLKRNGSNLVGVSILIVVSFVFFFQSISAYSDLFLPYKGIFINTDFQRHLY